ncbi:MAG TPA: hypothetical protein DCE44_06000 [Verrucomicrobiales bacterium]|nr:hypothetical protein [Verrucomicrobiales bacterium]
MFRGLMPQKPSEGGMLFKPIPPNPVSIAGSDLAQDQVHGVQSHDVVMLLSISAVKHHMA